MRNRCAVRALVLVCLALGLGSWEGATGAMEGERKLPEPQLKGKMTVEEAIARRRSRREFSAEPLTLDQVAQILWCAQGVTGARGFKRASPSAGATYPMEIFIAVGKGGVEGLDEGVYRYEPSGHSLVAEKAGDVRRALASAALDQGFLAAAPLDVLIAADYERTTRKYGARGRRYVHVEVGHIGQNIYLQAEALGLGTVAVGAFDDEDVAEVFGLPEDLEPLYLMPVGHVE